MEYQRALVPELTKAIEAHGDVMHIVVGPRQVGKTTAALQVLERLKTPSHFAAADSPLPFGPEWVESQWRLAMAKASDEAPVTLVLDELQKVEGLSEVLKRLWDERRRRKLPLRLIILGSSALLLQKGMTESLAGRFLLHRCTHWAWNECREAFGWGLDNWLYHGGYPGAAAFATDDALWRRYVSDSLVDTVLTRDIFQLQTVNKPALMRNLFGLAVSFPAQIHSYNKMLGQLQDAGNTTTLAHYLQLLSTAFVLSGLELFSPGQVRKRGSSPKLVFWNNALINAYSPLAPAEAAADPAWRGRLVENAVGAHLLNHLPPAEWSVTYWRYRSEEIDYVVQRGKAIYGIEVKSGRPAKGPAAAAFRSAFPKASVLLVGSGGIPLEDFFSRPPQAFLA